MLKVDILKENQERYEAEINSESHKETIKRIKSADINGPDLMYDKLKARHEDCRQRIGNIKR